MTKPFEFHKQCALAFLQELNLSGLGGDIMVTWLKCDMTLNKKKHCIPRRVVGDWENQKYKLG